MVEEHATSSARAAAGDCRPARAWWCEALVGYAAHAAEDYVAAEAAYDRALARMEGGQRCQWTNITLLLPHAPRDGYRDLDCRQRDSVERRFWWLADPLYLTPGNERRSEHFSRLVHVRFEQDAPSVSPDSWKDFLAPWLIRYGRPAGWERIARPSPSAGVSLETVTHYQGPTFVFEPRWPAIRRLDSIAPETLLLQPEAARTSYLPTYAARFDSLRYQVALFRSSRGAAVVVAYDLSSDSLPADAHALSGLFLQRNELADPVSLRVEQPAAGVLRLAAPEHGALLSLEAMALDGKRAGRVRYWLPITRRDPGTLSLSDILLLSRGEPLPQTLDQATPLARRNTAARRGETVGLYWEVYGSVGEAVPLTVSLTLFKEEAGWLRRAARAVGLAAKERPRVSLGWKQASRAGEATPGAIALDLAGNRPGRYTLRLQVTDPAGRMAETQRDLTIVENDGVKR